MKQCKVCGTLVHIDSNTCPSCGNHNFFVLDVKICPLCGKVNGIANSFCEQCGKPFVTAQGGAYVKRPVPLKRPTTASYPKVFNQQQEQPPRHAVSPAEQPQASVQEQSAKHAYKDFVALKPDVVEGDDYSEVSYYVKGEGDKLPVIILPKFAKTSGKNIIVNIVVEPKAAALPKFAAEPTLNREQPQADSVEAAPLQTKQEVAAQNTVNTVPAHEDFKPFSAIPHSDEPAISPAAKPFEDSADVQKSKAFKAVPSNKKQKEKLPGKGKRVFVGIIALVFALVAAVGMGFPYYYGGPNYATGLSGVLYQLGEWGVKVNISFIDLSAQQGYAAYVAAVPVSGALNTIVDLIPYAFVALAALLLLIVITSFITIFINKRKAAKVVLVLASGVAGLLSVAIALSIKFVFNSGFFKTLGVGLIGTGAALFVFFLFVLIFVRTKKKEKLSSI